MKRALECIVLLLTLLGASYSLKPFIGALYLSFGNYYLEEKMLFLAMEMYQTGLRFDQLNSKLHQKTGLLFLDLSVREKNSEYVEQGLAELRRARSLTGDPVADYRLGLAHEFIGEKKKAAYYFKRAFMRSDGTVGK